MGSRKAGFPRAFMHSAKQTVLFRFWFAILFSTPIIITGDLTVSPESPLHHPQLYGTNCAVITLHSRPFSSLPPFGHPCLHNVTLVLITPFSHLSCSRHLPSFTHTSITPPALSLFYSRVYYILVPSIAPPAWLFRCQHLHHAILQLRHCLEPTLFVAYSLVHEVTE